jgi:hypothetical protein
MARMVAAAREEENGCQQGGKRCLRSDRAKG